jgi:hypothetical protein
MSFSIIISVGGYGGFYYSKGVAKPITGQERRICIGWVAISLLTPEFDKYLDNVMKQIVGKNWKLEKI